MTDRKHPTDETLIAWLDEGRGDPREHLAACAECRARAEALERVLAAFRSDAFADEGLPEEALAAQRERILAAIRDRPRAPIRRRIWVPLAAAAGLAALLVLAPDREPPPAGGGTPLPVLAHADSAAAEAAEELLAGEADAESLHHSTADGPSLAASGLEAEFAGLPPADQAAILEELSTMTFDL